MYANPPIQEAVIDIQATLRSDITVEELRKFHMGLEARFPEEKQKISLFHGIELGTAGMKTSMTAASSVVGYAFNSHTGAKVVQVRSDGFTFNKLKPYSHWDEFSSEAYELWKKFSELAKPVNVSRIAVRYINKIEIPLPIVDLRDYCLLFPDIPKPIPQGLAEYFLRFIVPIEMNETGGAIVTVTFKAPTPRSAVLPLILDIDAYRQYDIFTPEPDKIWEELGRLRVFKNMVFENSLTERTKRMFQ